MRKVDSQRRRPSLNRREWIPTKVLDEHLATAVRRPLARFEQEKGLDLWQVAGSRTDPVPFGPLEQLLGAREARGSSLASRQEGSGFQRSLTQTFPLTEPPNCQWIVLHPRGRCNVTGVGVGVGVQDHREERSGGPGSVRENPILPPRIEREISASPRDR